MTSQRQRAERFRDLHQGPGMLVLPNPWDAGSAKMLASLGFDALATTSAGLAFSLGRRDAEGAVSRTEALENARAIVAVLEAVAPKPVNVLVGSPRLELSLDELEALGVKRVSLGSNLARVAFGAFHEAAQALARRDLEATRAAMPFDRINDLFR